MGSKCGKRVCSFIESEKYIKGISEDIELLIIPNDELLIKRLSNYNRCIVERPRDTFFILHNYLATKDYYKREKFENIIDDTTTIHRLACIADNNVVIGKNCIIEEFVSIKENTVIGDNCIIRAGTIVGGEGFEQKKIGNSVISVKHTGGVIIGNDVELQQNNTIDKAIYPWDDTILGDNLRTDNIVHIAHGVKIKKRVFIAAHTCVAGRVNIGDDVWIGPGVTLINGMSIGNNSRVNIGSVATRDVESNSAVTGNFAIEHSKFIRNLKLSNK